MQISELTELYAADVRNDMYLVIEDANNTCKISMGELAKWLVSQSKTQTRAYINNSIDKVTEALAQVKLLPDKLSFVGEPETKWDKDSDPYGFFWIKYNRPELDTYTLKITNTSTGIEVFRTEIKNAVPLENAAFSWKLRSYALINELSDTEKEASGLLFNHGKYVYRNEDANNSNILIIEGNNDNIIPAGTQLMIEILSDSFESIGMLYTVTIDDVLLASMK